MRAPMTPARQHREGSPEPAVVDALVEALFDDPFYQSITIDFAADLARRKLALGHYLAYSMNEAARMGVCLVAPGPAAGAAIWSMPASAAAQRTESAAKSRYLATILGPNGYRNYHRIVEFMAPIAERLVPPEAWYLSIVGVAPSAQGRGAGADLLAPTLAQARTNRVACFLETFTPRNLPFYERLGFRALAAPHEPTTRSAYVLMLRGATLASGPV